MAEMSININVDERALLNCSAGERIVVKVLNADGTEKEVIKDVTVPAEKTFDGAIAIYGKLQ